MPPSDSDEDEEDEPVKAGDKPLNMFAAVRPIRLSPCVLVGGPGVRTIQ
jgi:hypothetical protein